MSTIFENAIATSDSIFDLLNDYEKKGAKIKGLIAGIIANKRNDLGLSQKEFANYLNVSQSMVSKWESCNYNFTIDSLMSLLQKLDLSFSVCIDGIEISSDKKQSKEDINSYTKNKASGWNGLTIIHGKSPFEHAKGAA